MDIRKTQFLRDTLYEQGVNFCVSGFLTEDMLSGIAESLKKKMKIDELNKTTARSIFSVVVEMCQNIIRYSEENETSQLPNEKLDLRYGILAVGKEVEGYFVVCGNLVTNEQRDLLDKKLADIQAKDRKELKAMYKGVLRSGPPEGSKGAGIGFIEIALRASRGFEFCYDRVDDGHALFSLKAKI